MLQDVTEVEGMARMGKIRGAGLTVAENGPVEVGGQVTLLDDDDLVEGFVLLSSEGGGGAGATGR